MVLTPEEKALNAAFNLLKYRQRSVAELKNRLLKKGYPEKIVQKVIGSLKQNGYLNDKEFVKIWIKDRTQKNYGPRRIKQELFQKGIKKELIERELKKIFSVNPAQEEKGLLKAAEKKLKSYQELEPSVAWRRLSGYLLRRGFSPSLVYGTCQKLLKNKFRET